LETAYPILRSAVFVYVPLFIVVYIFLDKKKKNFVLPYLVALWILIPWLIFSAYSGELTDYYFILQLYIAVIIFAYLTNWLFSYKNIILRILVGLFWIYFAYVNIQTFFHFQEGNLLPETQKVQEKIRSGEIIHFVQGDPDSYLYYYLLYTNHRPAPFRM
jgi:hypothetical protein